METLQEKLVCAGGCHVDGHFVGVQRSFVNLHAAHVKVANTDRIGSISVNRLSALLHAEPSRTTSAVVILQLGHYESTKSLSLMGRRSGATPPDSARKKSSQRPSTPYEGNPPVRELVKRIGVAARDALSRSAFDTARFEAQLDVCLQRLRQTRPRAVFLLSTFPTQSRARNIYRRRANEILRRQAARHGVEFLDVYDTLYDQQFVHRSDLFIDEGHLNEAGHALLADLLDRHLAAAY